MIRLSDNDRLISRRSTFLVTRCLSNFRVSASAVASRDKILHFGFVDCTENRFWPPQNPKMTPLRLLPQIPFQQDMCCTKAACAPCEVGCSRADGSFRTPSQPTAVTGQGNLPRTIGPSGMGRARHPHSNYMLPTQARHPCILTVCLFNPIEPLGPEKYLCDAT